MQRILYLDCISLPSTSMRWTSVPPSPPQAAHATHLLHCHHSLMHRLLYLPLPAPNNSRSSFYAPLFSSSPPYTVRDVPPSYTNPIHASWITPLYPYHHLKQRLLCLYLNQRVPCPGCPPCTACRTSAAPPSSHAAIGMSLLQLHHHLLCHVLYPFFIISTDACNASTSPFHPTHATCATSPLHLQSHLMQRILYLDRISLPSTSMRWTSVPPSLTQAAHAANLSHCHHSLMHRLLYLPLLASFNSCIASYVAISSSSSHTVAVPPLHTYCHSR